MRGKGLTGPWPHSLTENQPANILPAEARHKQEARGGRAGSAEGQRHGVGSQARVTQFSQPPQEARAFITSISRRGKPRLREVRQLA